MAKKTVKGGGWPLLNAKMKSPPKPKGSKNKAGSGKKFISGPKA